MLHLSFSGTVMIYGDVVYLFVTAGSTTTSLVAVNVELLLSQTVKDAQHAPKRTK